MTHAFSFLFPFLLLMKMGQMGFRLAGQPTAGAARTVILALFALLMVLMPAGGLPAGRWLVSFQANTSILLVALLLASVLKGAFHIQMLDRKAALTGWSFAAGAGLLLYPMALGMGDWDPYCAGWHFSWLFGLTLALTIMLLILRNRFSIVLLAAVLAYDFNLLESNNLWDYLVDPLLAVLSLPVILWKYSQ